MGYNMSRVCVNCGEAYGDHIGDRCMTIKSGLFAPVKETYPTAIGDWRVYASDPIDGSTDSWTDKECLVTNLIRKAENRGWIPMAWCPGTDPWEYDPIRRQATIDELIARGQGLGKFARSKAPVEPAKPKRPPPQLPPEVWARPAEDTDYMAAVRAMCGARRD